MRINSLNLINIANRVRKFYNNISDKSELIRPSKIRLEASTFCQLRCPVCPNNQGLLHKVVGYGHLKLFDFQQILDANPWISHVELSNWGEIFLNPELLKIIQYAAQQHVILTADNGVNFNTVQDDILEGFVKYKFKSLTCSIDGASQASYALYRIGGAFDNVLGNIKKLNDYKEASHSEYPLLRWQFVIFGHNEHEIPVAQKMAKALNMEFSLKLNWSKDYAPVHDKEFVRQAMQGIACSREEYKQKYGISYNHATCAQLWNSPQINWDGKMLGCCANFWGDFGGNVFKDGFLHCVNSRRMNYARDMLLGKRSGKRGIPCAACHKYLDMQRTRTWLTMADIQTVQEAPIYWM